MGSIAVLKNYQAYVNQRWLILFTHIRGLMKAPKQVFL
jgi:hypothetical protein